MEYSRRGTADPSMTWQAAIQSAVLASSTRTGGDSSVGCRFQPGRCQLFLPVVSKHERVFVVPRTVLLAEHFGKVHRLQRGRGQIQCAVDGRAQQIAEMPELVFGSMQQPFDKLISAHPPGQ